MGGPSVNIEILHDHTKDVDFSYNFPAKILVRLEPKLLDEYMENIANYAFFSTMLVMISFFVMLNQIKIV